MATSSQQAVKAFQKAAAKLGYYDGEIDGDPGPLTAIALQQYFQPEDNPVPKWMIWATQELGIHEIAGPKAHPRIVHYHSFSSLGAKSDEVAWCSSFINAALLEGAGIIGTKSAAAASYKAFGKYSPSEKYGTILLFRTNTGSLRHVALSAGSWFEWLFVLGGNQSNQVKITMRKKSEVTESRWPA